MYVLLDRLKRKLPTAIQLRGGNVVIFNNNGAGVCGEQDDVNIGSEYWALSDSNDEVIVPCMTFRRSSARLIQASSPRPDRWEKWTKYRQPSRVTISELPRPLEIVAIGYVEIYWGDEYVCSQLNGV